MIHIWHGPDEFRMSERLAEIRLAGCGNGETAPFNFARLDGAGLSLADLAGVCSPYPFLADSRVVTVTGLLTRFDPRPPNQNQKAKTRNPATPAPQPPPHRPFLEYLTGELPAWTELVLLEEKLSARNPLLEGLRPSAESVEFPLLKRAELDAWIVDRARLAGATIAPLAVRLLATRIGSDLRQMASEISKLALYVKGGAIAPEDVRLLTPIVREESIFSLLDDLMERRPGPALARLEELRQHGTTEQHILFLIARQYRQLLLAVSLRRQGATVNDIRRELHLTSSYAWQKTEEHMARVQETRLKAALHHVLACDVAIKTGRVEPRLALVLLLDSLSPLAGRESRVSGLGSLSDA